MLQDPKDIQKTPATSAEWLQLDKKYRLQTRYTAPVVLERGRGCMVWDVEGRAYLDFVSGQVCNATGHSHPRYAAAIGAQAAKFIQRGSGFTDTEQCNYFNLGFTTHTWKDNGVKKQITPILCLGFQILYPPLKKSNLKFT